MLRGAWLESAGCGVVLGPMALRSLEVERHVYRDSASERQGTWKLGRGLFLENSLSSFLLALVRRVDLASNEAGWLVGLRLPGQEERAHLEGVALCLDVGLLALGPFLGACASSLTLLAPL